MTHRTGRIVPCVLSIPAVYPSRISEIGIVVVPELRPVLEVLHRGIIIGRLGLSCGEESPTSASSGEFNAVSLETLVDPPEEQ